MFDFDDLIEEKLDVVKMDGSFLDRSVNEGFSGGEKKRNEILQMALLNPTLSILDETDSGLDIDALKTVASGVNQLAGEHQCHAGDYPLSTVVELYRARLRACDGRWANHSHGHGKNSPWNLRSAAMNGWWNRPRQRCSGNGSGVVNPVIMQTQSATNRDAYLTALLEQGTAQISANLQLNPLRSAAQALVKEQTFPSTRDEEWRFTDLSTLMGKDFQSGWGSPASFKVVRVSRVIAARSVGENPVGLR